MEFTYNELRKYFKEWSEIYFEMSESERTSGRGEYVLTLLIQISQQLRILDQSLKIK
jgi:hypothetical protein